MLRQITRKEKSRFYAALRLLQNYLLLTKSFNCLPALNAGVLDASI